MYFVEQTRNVWFGGRLLRTGPAATPTKLATDHLGSIRLRQTGANPIEYLTYAAYGEQRSCPSGEGEKFGTYYRDQTGLDYADQRYYQSQWGRFATVDPARDGRNWYAYANGDPVLYSDPSGLAGCVYQSETAVGTTGICPKGYLYYSTGSIKLVRQPGETPGELHPAHAWATTFLTTGEDPNVSLNDCASMFGFVTPGDTNSWWHPRYVLDKVLDGTKAWDGYTVLSSSIAKQSLRRELNR